MTQIQTELNETTKTRLLEQIKNGITQAFFIGDSSIDWNAEEYLTANPNYEDFKTKVFLTLPVRSAYYDENSNLCFEILLDYESVYSEYIRAIAIGNESEIFTLALTPKIQKIKGVGGTFVFKTNITGNNATMVFKTDHYISETELNTLKEYLSHVQNDITNQISSARTEIQTELEAKKSEIDTQIKTLSDEIQLTLEPLKDFKEKFETLRKQVVLEMVDNYCNEEIARLTKQREEREQIGRKDYFYRNSLPNTHVPLGKTLKASDYPLLWYYTISTAGNDGGLTFRLPAPNLYSQGTDNPKEVGQFRQSGLPNITGNIGVDRAHSLYGGGAFEPVDPKNHFDVGNRYYQDNYYGMRFDASRSSPVYGRSEDVDVSRNLYLEGIYAGKPLDPEKKEYYEMLQRNSKYLYEDLKAKEAYEETIKETDKQNAITQKQIEEIEKMIVLEGEVKPETPALLGYPSKPLYRTPNFKGLIYKKGANNE
ncbi:hypothetical protein BKH41_03805 [Helicobacter sp. 12S02232-10]|uniref:hypothetical protein n=1 Tax=Helicobacter sp. 12S02232-10 TaxID=1476197 RepID=UPI000BA4ED0F|nr:hypothetical protein [Helicobacter sp. 12S02232-10]PAF49215.1 hypothetical protein BKH41_03805 [Helicobacter sp. 12S02232-10]